MKIESVIYEIEGTLENEMDTFDDGGKTDKNCEGWIEALKYVLGLLKPKEEPKPVKAPMQQVFTTEDFWDCECEENYIHSKAEYKCDKCGFLHHEMPDSRVNEVIYSLLKSLYSLHDADHIHDLMVAYSNYESNLEHYSEDDFSNFLSQYKETI